MTTAKQRLQLLCESVQAGTSPSYALKTITKALHSDLKTAMPKEISVQETEDRQLYGYNYCLEQVHRVLGTYFDVKPQD